jgi:tRNA G10  N-methylase Trm11
MTTGSEPYYQDASVTVYGGDCLDVLPELPDNSVDCVITDPPYGLAEHKRKDVEAALLAWLTGDRARVPSGPGGFMGRSWDRFVPPPAVWDECFRVLKPGGHLLAFAGSRTFDLMGMSIRLAGLTTDVSPEIRDSIAWLYGSGFPKSLDVSKAIDRRAEENVETKRRIALVAEVIRRHREAKGLERTQVSLAVVGTPSGACWNWEHHQLPSVEMWPAIKRTLSIPDEFDGLIQGDRAQFIAAERAVLAAGTSGKTYNMGGIRGIEIGTGEFDITAPATPEAAQWQGWGTALKPASEPIVVARKPLVGTVAANVLRYGTGALNIDACRIGTSKSVPASTSSNPKGTGDWGFRRQTGEESGHDPNTGRWPANVVLDESQAAALDQMSGELTSGSRQAGEYGLMGYHGSEARPMPEINGDSGGASRYFYTAKAGSDERITHNGVSHPTVKPLSLMRWLVRLVTPPGGVILDPFAGSGTTVEAAILEGFRCIAIERGTDYLPLITQRINRRRDPIAYLTQAGDDLGLFGEVS